MTETKYNRNLRYKLENNVLFMVCSRTINAKTRLSQNIFHLMKKHCNL